MDEFSFISRLLRPLTKDAPESLQLRDDAALLRLPADRELVVTTDMLVSGTHFLREDPPGLIARKALRVNASDLAGKGAEPWGWLISLALKRAHMRGSEGEAWLRAFADGMKTDLAALGGALFGGDTTLGRGNTVISVTAFGLVPCDTMLRRDGARDRDRIWVSGELGDAACGLAALRGRLDAMEREDRERLTERYRLPVPRLALGRALRGTAHAAMDVSDGIVQDLGHLCAASGLDGRLDWDCLPVSAMARRALAAGIGREAISWGDDYEILFTAPPQARERILALGRTLDLRLTEIGEMRAGSGRVTILDRQGAPVRLKRLGWRHF